MLASQESEEDIRDDDFTSDEGKHSSDKTSSVTESENSSLDSDEEVTRLRKGVKFGGSDRSGSPVNSENSPKGGGP